MGYTYGMTMTREAKSEHTWAMAQGPHAGYTVTRFASPTLIRSARAERGHAYMTVAEYVEHRMGRKPEGNIAGVIEQLGHIRRQQRIMIERPVIGRHRRVQARRVTGLTPGTRQPTGWSCETVERCVRRAA